MRINTHILSLMSQRTLLSTTKALARAMQRLASGQRINSARDDAAGMALGTGLESQRRGMMQAVRNINDSRGFLSTAEGALAAQTELIQRMRELALQSANGTLSDTERGYLNTELQQLVSEFDRIANQTEFNGVKLLDGSFATTSLQVGTAKGQRIDVNLTSSRSSDIFFGSYEDEGGAIVGTGAFLSRVTISNQSQAISMDAGDFNNDGAIDLLTTRGGAVRIWFGNGNGSFQNFVSLSTGGNARDAIGADVNGDGHLDIVQGNSDSTVAVALGNGNGTFMSVATFVAGSIGFGAATLVYDLNNDGKLDVVTSDTNDNAYSVLLGNGNGTFQSRTTLSTDSQPNSSHAGDINGDGIVDLVGSAYAGHTFSLYIGNGDGTFQTRTTIGGIGGGNPGEVMMADLNSDGKLDIIGAIASSDLYNIYLGNGNGTFGAALSLTRDDASNLDISDINGDGYLDLIASDLNSVAVSLGRGDGTFQSPVTYTTGGTPVLDVADFNNDGVPDIATADYGSTTISILLAETTGGPATIELNESDLNIVSQTGAQKALVLLDSALGRLSSKRSNIGAIQSRLDYAENNALNLIENISAARSQLMDADFAVETAEFARLQILQQAGLAVMGQANLNLRLVLELLR